MSNRVHISSNDVISYEIDKYTKPEFVYIPLESKNKNLYTSIVKEGDYVYKGQVIAICEDINFPIHSSVSGYISRYCDKVISNGKKVKCIAIENDFKEKYEKDKLVRKDISSYSKKEFVNYLKLNGITGLGGSDYPTFLKYDHDNIKCLIVNAVECEPFISCDKAVIHNYSENILETIDLIMGIFKISKAIIAVKESNSDSIKEFNKFIGTYPGIKICPVKDAYPSGWERIVVRDTLHIEYDKYPIEKGIIVNNVSTIYAIYEMFKFNRPLTERVITVTGPGVKNRRNVKVKIGSLLCDVINSLDGYNKIKNPLLIAGGPMMGNSLSNDDAIVTKDLNSVLVIEDNFEENLPCIKCGKCMEVCPVNISPVLIMKNCNKINRLDKLDTLKCIECGLCSFNCPSKIEVREFVRIAKEKVKNK